MVIKFKKIRLNNFMSFGDSTIDLDRSGYTFVIGVNNNPDDSAKSNGSGKSSIWEGISWAITGDTIRGCKDVTNMKGNDGAYVELDFTIDNDEYKIIRTKDHSKYKTNLKIFINGEDKSGKGIRDSEKLLAGYLPDLTGELIGSVIILGQGLPQRFTNNTPSGRKEVLEKLSKSDFMITDLKERVSRRKEELSKQIREVEDEALRLNTYIRQSEALVERYTAALTDMPNASDLDEQIKEIGEQVKTAEKELTRVQSDLNVFNNDLKVANEELLKLTTDGNNACQAVDKKYREQLNPLNHDIIRLQAEVAQLEREIKNLENVKDVCPTCGQKLPNVHKIDTTSLKNQHDEDVVILGNIKKDAADLDAEWKSRLEEVKAIYTEDIDTLKVKKQQCEKQLTTLNDLNRVQANNVSMLKEKINKLTNDKNLLDQNKKMWTEGIADANKQIQKCTDDTLYNIGVKRDLDERLMVINKMVTVINRDFRGFLLTSIIDYIDKTAKGYCKEVFDTEKLDFKLDGNAISISYDGKEYEQLSGGEQQKINIIIQFAIRTMLCKYLNFSSNILVLDEIYDALDSDGSEKINNLISRHLTDVEGIYIISHHQDIGIPMDYELVVEKSACGISDVR